MKYRVKTWWWGNYVVKVNGLWEDEQGKPWPLNYTPSKEDPQWEEYIEEKHGKHNEEKGDNE